MSSMNKDYYGGGIVNFPNCPVQEIWEICTARDARCVAICTARILSIITLLVPPLASQLVKISTNVKIRPLTMLQRPLATL